MKLRSRNCVPCGNYAWTGMKSRYNLIQRIEIKFKIIFKDNLHLKYDIFIHSLFRKVKYNKRTITRENSCMTGKNQGGPDSSIFASMILKISDFARAVILKCMSHLKFKIAAQREGRTIASRARAWSCRSSPCKIRNLQNDTTAKWGCLTYLCFFLNIPWKNEQKESRLVIEVPVGRRTQFSNDCNKP